MLLIFTYCSKGQGEACILTRQMRIVVSIPKLKSGFVWWDYFASPHHVNSPYYSVVPCHEICKKKKFILVITYKVPTLNTVNYDVIADKVPFVLMGKCWQVVDYYFLVLICK